MLEDFDKFVLETQVPPQVSNTQNLPAIVTLTLPIVTISIQSQELATQVLTTRVDEDASLPPWLVSNTPKRKTQAISLDDFDFNQLVSAKPKVTKKAKTLSRLRIDQSKNKYVEMAISPPNTDLDKVQATNFVIKIIDLGEQTHEDTIEDAQNSFQHLVAMFNEEKVKKNNLKKQVDQLTGVLIKITKSSEAVEPITSSVDEQIVKQVKQANSRGRIASEWMDILLG